MNNKKSVIKSQATENSECKQIANNNQQLENLAEEKTREREESKQTLIQVMDSMNEIFFMVDKQWRVTYYNRKAEEVFLKNRHEVLGKNIWQVSPESVETEFYHQLHQAMQQNRPVFIEVKSSNYAIWVETRVYPSPNGLAVFMNDISQRKQIEHQLRLSNEQFQKAFDTNPLPMAILAVEDERFLKTNKALKQKHELKRLEPGATDETLWEDVSERQKFYARIKSEQTVRNFAASMKTISGENRVVLFSTARINWQGKEAILAVSNDVTDIKRYEDKIAHLDRLKLIGVTAAGIAHEIRNPLTTVKGFLQLFQEKERYASDRQHIDLMIEELDRANIIITELLSLSKNKPVNLKCQNLNDLIRKFLPLLEADAIKHDAYIQLELEEIPDLMLNEDEMRQLILNLVQNGIEAMPAGGLITIKTYQESNKVILAVTDQGSGISPEVIDKIGIPFFTTKNHGTGLGVATCYNIAYKNNARMKFETSSAGTVFRVIFRISEENNA